MGKDRRKDKADEDESLGKKADKYGKKGDGKHVGGVGFQPDTDPIGLVRGKARTKHELNAQSPPN